MMIEHLSILNLILYLLSAVNGVHGGNSSACPPDGSALGLQMLHTRDACTCADPRKSWTGIACCVPNANWNGTACGCSSGHEWVGDLCCLTDDHKGWGPERCGCPEATYWNGNSCLPEGVVCPPNALWNGTCYCKPAHWETDTHADVMANGACCPEHAYYEWGTVNDRWWRGTCHCLDGYQWNGTSCILPPGAGWSVPVKVGVGAGGGIGAALILASCATVLILMCKAHRGHGANDQLPRCCFAPLADAASCLSRGDSSGPLPWSRGHAGNAGNPPKWSVGREIHRSGASDPNVSSGAVHSTALDLFKGTQLLSDAQGESEEPLPEVVLVFAKEDAQTSSQPPGVTGNGATHQRSVTESQGGSRKSNRAVSFHSVWTRIRGCGKHEETPDVSRLEPAVASGLEPAGASGLEPAAASGGPMEKVELERESKVVGNAQHEELWTRGVDPADVDILRDTCGKPLVLGRGAFAVVYLGRWQATLVAVKVMLAADSDAAQREVQAEADILRGLRHPNVVLLMAVCLSPGQQMMVILEYCGGGNLHKALQKDERNTERRLGWYSARSKQPGNGYSLALDIARGLAYLHHRQLIHFDIKPANVLLDHAWTHAKISDVGLSKAMHGSVVSQTMRGTPVYMAPELITFKHAPSYAVDVYSFGVVLHHIITGEAPDQRTALRPLRVHEECSAAVASLYESCLQDDPQLRPTASEIVCTLEKEF